MVGAFRKRDILNSSSLFSKFSVIPLKWMKTVRRKVVMLRMATRSDLFGLILILILMVIFFTNHSFSILSHPMLGIPGKFHSPFFFNLSYSLGFHQANIPYWLSVDHRGIFQVCPYPFLFALSMPVHLADPQYIPLSKYIVYSDYIRQKAEAFIEKNKISPDNMLGIHLRNGVDFVSK